MLRVWQTLRGRFALTYPYTVFLGRASKWGFGYTRHNLVVSEDTTTPYSILHVGPYEFFIRPYSIIL